MKRLTVLIIFSMLLMTGTGVAYADKHNNKGKGHDRKEQRFDHRDNRGNNKHNGRDKKADHYKFDSKGHNSPGWGNGHSKRNNKVWAPAPPPPPAPDPYRYDIERNHRFQQMVARAAYGGSDVRVWRIDRDTYIVKYRKGRRWYTRKFYPYSNRFDAPGLININWNPLSAWTLLPSININIPINLN